jgi:hypothetical protein
MTNFKVGQKVVCIKKDKWMPPLSHFPKYGDVCTINYINRGFLIISGFEYSDGFHRWYDPNKFRPLAEYSDATQEILSKFKPTEDTPDVEIKVHETAN